METKTARKHQSKCTLCPRKCGVNRRVSRGFCGASDKIEISKIMLHHWEEPPISGSDSNRGSGAVFFTHCPLGCVYCQNRKISARSSVGKTYTVDELAEAILKLQADGAYNINFVSPTQYTEQIIEAVRIARGRGLTVPIVWNTGGYERIEVIESLRGTVDIFLTDVKYATNEIAGLYSSAADYPDVAINALKAMYDAVGKPVYDDDGMLKSGVIVRHLVLPSHKGDSIEVLQRIADAVPAGDVLLSLMAQYTPEFLPKASSDDALKKIRRRITSFEYDSVLAEASRLGFDGFTQDRASATKSYTPEF